MVSPVIYEAGASFYLYNLSGQIVGYQHYNPTGTKALNQSKADRSLMKYFTWIGGTRKSGDKKIGVWGLESYYIGCKRIIITEGLFDAAVFHNYGECAIAILTNDPSKEVLGWLDTLCEEKIVVRDADKAGAKLEKAGNRSLIVPGHKDANDFWVNNKDAFEEWYKNEIAKE